MEMRSFVEQLQEHGLLRCVTQEVDVILELGRLTRECRKPILFEKLSRYPGFRLFSNGLSESQTLAIALGLPVQYTRRQIAQELSRRISHPIAPCMLTTGRVLQNQTTSSTVDLTVLPVPRWHPSDSGRYLGTWHINVTRDTETQQRNVGVYRMELLDAKRATVSTSPRSHLGIQVAKAEQSGKALPMAIAIGVPETTMMAAAASFSGTDEYALAGALQQEPLQLIQCRTVDLEVPVSSEIVVEGFIQPGERTQDGPYLDYAGVPSTNCCAFVFEATALSYRDNPIFRGASIGQPGAEDHQLFAALADVGLLDFHGQRIKQKVQNFLLRRRSFHSFQLVGRLSNPLS